MRFEMPNMDEQAPTLHKAMIDYYCALTARQGLAFSPREQDTPNMTVRLEAGAILSGVTLTEVAAQSTGTITAPVTHPRIDRVVIDRITGAVSVVEGTEAASPAAPAIPTGKLPVAQVLLATDTTAITNADLTDERVGGGSVAIGSIASPSTTEVASTQDVADTLAAFPQQDTTARQQAMFNALLAHIHVDRASGAVPSGYLHLFKTDELATKTNATYQSGSRVYDNQASSTADTGSPGSGSSGLDGYTACDSACTITNGRVVTGVRVYSTSGGTITPYILRDDGGGNHTVVASGSAQVHPGGGFATLALTTSYTVPGSGTYRPAAYSAAFGGGYLTTTRIYKSGAASGTQAYSSDSNSCIGFGYAYQSSAGNMTLITTAITAPESVTSIAIGILHKAVDAVTLNTDLKLRFSADDGANWTGFLTLEEVCPFDSDYKMLWAEGVVEDTGTAAKWEITTLNAKAQQLRAADMLFN
ncbi:MAG: hypothetical protein AB9900_10930 [Humidesulfovibrio sp.]